MSKSQTSLKSRVSQQNVRSRPGTGSSVKRSESRASRTSVKGSPYETDLLPSAVTRNASHESLKSTSSKMSIKSTKSTQSGKSIISSRKSSASFRSAVSQESDRSGTDGGFRIKMNEDSSEAAVPYLEEKEVKQDESDTSDFKHNSKKEYTFQYDIPCANIKESEAPINQVGKDNENSEAGNNDAGDDVEENLKRVRDLLEDLKSPNHIVRDESNGLANEQISEESSVKNEKAHNSQPYENHREDGEQSGGQSPANSEQILEVSNLNDLQNSTDNNEEDVMNTNLSAFKEKIM